MALFNFKSKKKKVVSKRDMDWGQAKVRYPKLSPFGDADRDGVKNWLDCKPFDRKRQDEKVSAADKIALYLKAKSQGIDPETIINWEEELKNKKD